MHRPRPSGPFATARRAAVGAVILASLGVAPGAQGQDSGSFGFWTPRDGSPITQEIADKIPVDGGECMVLAVAKMPAGFLALFTDDKDLGLPQQPEFVDCMQGRGWVQAPPADYRVRRIEGQAKDCADRGGVGCAGVLNNYLHGVPDAKVPLDIEKGLALGRRLCQGGDGDVCLTLASVFMHGAVDTGIKADAREALEWADLGCRAPHAASCGFAGVMLSTPNHPGLRQDPIRGKEYLARACDMGMAEACDWPRRPEDVLPDANLPGGYKWCKFALAHVDGGEACPDAQVNWLALPGAAGCVEAMDVRVGNCRYTYALGK